LGLYPAEWTTHLFYPDWIMAIIVWARLGIVYVDVGPFIHLETAEQIVLGPSYALPSSSSAHA
jgi:hypothetical protein